MKIKQLKARGFLGFKRGLGQDEVCCDLSGLSGLVAICGENGRGKTTFLELLTPFRSFASRSGALKNHVFLRDSFKELTFDHAGHEYRTMVKIDAESDKSEGFIWRDGKSLVSGKAREYDKKIVELFGSPELFFSSVFCAQNSAKLSDMTVGEIKGLFAEFLQLDKLAGYEQAAKQAGQAVLTLAEAKSREIDRFSGCADIDEIQQEIGERELQAAANTAEISQNAQLLAAAQRDLADAQKAEAQNAVVMEKAAGIRRETSASVERWWQYKNATEKALQDMRAQCAAEMAQLEKVQALAGDNTDFDALSVEKSRIQTEQAERDRQLAEIDTRLHDVSVAVLETEKQLNAQKQIMQAVKNDTEHARLTAEAEACKRSMAVLEKRSAICNDPTCELIAAAVHSAKRFDELQGLIAEIEHKNDAVFDQAKAEAERLQAVLTEKENAYLAAKADKQAAGMTSSAAVLRLREIDVQLARQAEVAAARERVSGIEKRVAEIKAAGIAKRSELEQREKTHNEEMTRLDELVQEIEAQIDTAAPEGVPASQRRIETLQTAQSFAQKKAADIQAALATARARLESAKADMAKVDALRAELEGLKAEAAEWKYLQDACGKNGLQALEIDGTAPAITEYANAILRATYGPAFSVRISTQDPETGKETFDIIVIADDGTEILLENLSGGQRVWILKALRLAMTLISKEKSEHDFRTAFGDEEDGALDSEKARAFVDMYRQFMKSGGFDAFFYISHRPECVAMADHVIELTESGITIN